MTITTHSLEETIRLGHRIGELLFAGATILLDGQLGAGKTALTKGIAQGLGVTTTVNSPTFTIVKVHQGRFPLYHIDAYRLANRPDDIGLEELIFSEGITVIEWPEFAKVWIPAEFLLCQLDYVDDHSRQFTFIARGKRYEDLVKEFSHA